MFHICVRVRGSSPVVGSSRKMSGGWAIRLAARSRRRRMPPEYWVTGFVAASDKPELLEEFTGLALRRAAPEALQAREEHEILDARECLVERGVLSGEADELADDLGLAHDVVAEDAGVAGVGPQECREHRDRRGLARAVRAEHPVDRSGRDPQVDAVDGTGATEGLDEAVGLDRPPGAGIAGHLDSCSCRSVRSIAAGGQSCWRRAMSAERSTPA